MNFTLLPDEKLNEIISKVDNIQLSLSKIQSMDYLDKKWLDVKEASKFLKVTTRSMFNYRDRGLIPFSDFGGKILFRQGDLEKFLMNHRVEAISFRNKTIGRISA